MKLKELRLERGLSQKQIADYLEVTPNIYSRYETGARQPSIETLIKLSAFFGKSIDFIVGNHTEADYSLSDYELELLTAAREADSRAKEDALSLLKIHHT
ncbi:MAG: helix-turn-helix transcriptional regulator [Lachnospiraceae bacterium]|nr:helix-turn-helix transcriptional regulator [Lachnospiraceae bacterium]